MGQTNRKYPIMEAAISLEDAAPHSGGERKLAGDIIALRREGVGEIGKKERHGYLWLRLEGLEENDFTQLTESLEQGGERFDKRRYCIPLNRLERVVPGFSISRAMDPADPYQPFMPVDEDVPHSYLDRGPILSVEGLVFDKVTGRYL